MFFTCEDVNEPAIRCGVIDVRENLIAAAGPTRAELQDIEESIERMWSVKNIAIHEWCRRSDVHQSSYHLNTTLRRPYAIDPRSPDRLLARRKHSDG